MKRYALWLIILLPWQIACAASETRSYLVIDNASKQNQVLERLLQLPPDLLHKVSLVRHADRFLGVVTHLSQEADLSLWRSLYASYGFTPVINPFDPTMLQKSIVIDLATPPRQTVREDEANLTLILEARGRYQPTRPNRNDLRHGTAQNREASVTLYVDANQSNDTACDTWLADPRLCALSPSEKRGHLYTDVLASVSTGFSLVDYNSSKVKLQSDENHSLLGKPMVNLMADLKQNNAHFKNVMHRVDPFLGFYFTGDYGEYMAGKYSYRKHTSYEYLLKFRWELFDDGYYESKKELAEKMNETEVDYRQLLSDMIDRNYNDKLSQLQGYTITIRRKYFAKMVAAYTKLLRKREEQLRHGFTTLDDTEHIRERLETMRLNSAFYDSQEGVPVDPKLFVLLNRIECLKLTDKARFKRDVVHSNVQVLLQNNFMRRADFMPSFTDQLKVNLYTLHRRVENVGWYDVLGIHADIPLTYDSERDELARLEKHNYKLQQAAIIKRLEQNIDSLYYQFYELQTQVKIKQNSLRHLLIALRRKQKLAETSVNHFENDPLRETQLLHIEIMSARYDIMMKRLDMYSILLRLYHISNADNLNRLLKEPLQ